MSNPLTLSAPADEPLMEYSRDFDFPVHDVFRAHVEPDAYAQWIGPQDVAGPIGSYIPEAATSMPSGASSTRCARTISYSRPSSLKPIPRW